MEFDGFDWDQGNRQKCQKHGVSIAQIEEMFRGVVLVGPDAKHSVTEERFRAIGRTVNRRGIFVAFTWRVRDAQRLIRPVSARHMHQKEVKAYEEKISGFKNG